ncbi:MAG: hypothetical protein LBL06_03680 [Treponema sp.]|nr:hypothetical protein [Treponema sp.]
MKQKPGTEKRLAPYRLELVDGAVSVKTSDTSSVKLRAIAVDLRRVAVDLRRVAVDLREVA